MKSTELANSITDEEIFTDSINDTASKEESLEEKEHKLHRIILLRSWLLHFIGNVHDYFMTRVLQSTQIGKYKHKIKELPHLSPLSSK